MIGELAWLMEKIKLCEGGNPLLSQLAEETFVKVKSVCKLLFDIKDIQHGMSRLKA
jgi:hypothetical protein